MGNDKILKHLSTSIEIQKSQKIKRFQVRKQQQSQILVCPFGDIVYV